VGASALPSPISGSAATSSSTTSLAPTGASIQASGTGSGAYAPSRAGSTHTTCSRAIRFPNAQGRRDEHDKEQAQSHIQGVSSERQGDGGARRRPAPQGRPIGGGRRASQIGRAHV